MIEAFSNLEDHLFYINDEIRRRRREAEMKRLLEFGVYHEVRREPHMDVISTMY